MQLTQIRNATVRITYAGTRFLVDPMLAPKGSYPGFPGTLNDHLSNPLVELPMSLDEITDVDAVIVTHTHLDHWDPVAAQVIPKEKTMFVQHQQDAELLEQAGFRDIRVLDEHTEFNGITLVKTPGQHGSDTTIAALRERLGEVCGIIFQHPAEKNVYLAGDTVWNDMVRQTLSRFCPETVILNAGDAQIPALGSIIMGKDDLWQVHQAAPDATLIAVHLEAVNHAALSRRELAAFVAEKSISGQVLIPQDGETLMC
ncbi:MBL fold metallo-hydrolase [Vibrio mangrovi]|uniref:MBL fold metallo-hydrolase n=1 Tax=Vibrio mangrovi TaxID=474394 RepID=A0A1Y6ISF0_9VIBR|nr:MBL fold metallo-hydrolase [Vibrio mangrovi]MDW6001379.1 MBL fold metallo-hydrolase [Vibrio mangrovi]SMS00599.1 metal-dependent hydrolase [Vibrio mangrovi]